MLTSLLVPSRQRRKSVTEGRVNKGVATGQPLQSTGKQLRKHDAITLTPRLKLAVDATRSLSLSLSLSKVSSRCMLRWDLLGDPLSTTKEHIAQPVSDGRSNCDTSCR